MGMLFSRSQIDSHQRGSVSNFEMTRKFGLPNCATEVSASFFMRATTLLNLHPREATSTVLIILLFETLFLQTKCFLLSCSSIQLANLKLATFAAY